jgi:hypothetical protein
MSKEIFTTADMNEIVTPIHKAMEEGNPVAKLVFDINEAINNLKPGRPISKAERDRIEFMWDNLIVGIANETRGIAEHVVADDEIVKAGSFIDTIRAWDDAYSKKNNTGKEATDKNITELSAKEKLYIIDLINQLVKIGIDVKDVAEIFRTSEEVIIGIIKRDDGAEEGLFKEYTMLKALTGIAASEALIASYSDDDEGDQNKCCGECGSDYDDSCNELNNQELDDAIKAVYKILEDAEKEKKAAEKKPKCSTRIATFPGGYYTHTRITSDAVSSFDDVIRKLVRIF